MTQRRPTSDIPQGEWKEEKDKGVEIDVDDQAMQQAVMGMASTERYVRLYRINDQGGRPKLIESLIPQDFNETYVQSKFGGGRFQAKWIDKSGRLFKYPFEIEGKAKFVDDESEDDEDFQTVQPVAQHFQPSQPAGPSFMEIIGLMNEARKDARMENAEMMRMMMEGLRPQAVVAAPSGIEQTLGFVKELLPIIGQGGGGGGEPMPWYANVLIQLKDPLAKLLDTANTVVLNSGKQQPVQQKPSPRVQANHAKILQSEALDSIEPVEEEGDDMIASQFKQYLPVLLRGASKNTDPQVYVDMILDQVPRMAYDPLRKWLLVPGCLDKLAAIEPGIKFQVEWWESLQSGLIEALNEELGDGIRSIQSEPNTDASTINTTPSASSDTES